MVLRIGDDVYAVAPACTHYSGPLNEGLIVGHTVRCPLHHACFDLRTGEALRAPALNPIPCWSVERRGDRVYVGAKRERDPLAPLAPLPAGAPRVQPSSVVIVGAGAAGAAAAEMLRRRGYGGPVTLVEQDAAEPVDRPNLSKDYLDGHAQAEWIPLRPEGFYDEHGITIRRGTAIAIDVAVRQLRLAQGGAIPYDALLLATGAEPRNLDVRGANASHVHCLRTLADSDAIIAAARGARRAVVIGSSFIGLEVAASLRTRGLDVDVVSVDAEPLARVMGPDLSAMIRRLHEGHGVRFHLSAGVARIDPGAVVLADGTSLGADVVVLGVGVRPRVALAESAGLDVDDGVVVNEFLETSQPGIWAAGDIARWPDPHTGRSMRIEHWVLAERQGQAAAENILGAHQRFDAVPFFWSQHYDVTIRYSGFATRWDRADADPTIAQGKGSVFFRAGGRTLAVASVQEDHRNLEAEAAMERDVTPR